MVDKIRAFFSFLWRQKFKGLLILILIPLFAIFQFPVDDLSDMVTTQVAQQTHNQVYLQFDKMELGFLPLSIRLEKMSLDLPNLPTLNVNEVQIYPSLVNLLLQKPAGSIIADGIFRGKMDFSMSPGKKLEGGVQTQDLELEAKNVQLNDLRQFLKLPVTLRGRVDLKLKGYADLTFSAPPDINLELQSPDVELSSSTVNTIMGPLVLPDLKLNRLNFKGRLSNNQLTVEETLIGRENDEASGTLRGNLQLEIKPLQGGIVPILGSYAYKVDMKIQKTLEDRARLFLMMVETHKRPEGADSRYRFTLNGDARTGAFNVNALQ